MAETWYFRNTAGLACGHSNRNALSQTPGSASLTQAIIAGANFTWNRQETARRISPGTWIITAFIQATASGRSCRMLVERRDSGCVVQETILDVTKSLTVGAAEYSFSDDIAFIDFAANDILTICVESSHVDSSVRVRFDGVAGGGRDSRLSNPDTLPPISGRPKIVAAEVYMPGFRAAENAILKGSDNG